MKLRDGFILRKVGKQYVVVATGNASKNYNGMMRLNESSAEAFRLLQKDITEEALIEKLLEQYEVSEEVLRRDVAAFLNKLREANALV